MTRPNFFCGIDSLKYVLEMEYEDDYEDIDFTIDLIDFPYLLIFTSDDEEYSLKAMLRGEIYFHNEMGIEYGSLVVNKKSLTCEKNASTQDLEDNMDLFYHICRNLSCYIQDNNLDEVCADFDPEKEGILLYVEDDTLKYKIVSGCDRPDMMCATLKGECVMTRPYMDEFESRSERDDMSIEEKIKAAENGDDDCMLELAALYEDGDEDENIEPDPEKSLYWIKKSAEGGNSSSALLTGLFYAKGYGTERSFEKAVEWMEKAADMGDETAEKMASQYRQANIDLVAAENGDAQAQSRLAAFYMAHAKVLEEGGTEDYYQESLKWAKRAADQEEAGGYWTLALAYEHGRGVDENIKTALEYYKKGAEAGHARSLNSFGCYYMRGDMVKQNMKYGFEMVLRASLLGDGEAMVNLGRAYQFGYGCMGNMQKAITWYRKSLELIPNEQLEQKVSHFEEFVKLYPDSKEDYLGEDSNRKLTAKERKFISKIDESLPEDVRKLAHNPDAVFDGIIFE